MKNSRILTVVSLLSILFLILHVTDDYVRGISKVQPSANLIVFPFLALMLYGTLMLAERRSGYIIQLVVAIFAWGCPACISWEPESTTSLRGAAASLPSSRSCCSARLARSESSS